MTIRIFLCSLLLALSASAQTPLPARQVSVDTNSWSNLFPLAATAQAALDYVDANWQPDLVVSNWSFLAPSGTTAQATFDFLDGYAGTNGLLKGTNIVGFSFSDGQWAAPASDPCAALLNCYPFLDVDFRDDAAAEASTNLVSGAVFRAVVPAGVYSDGFVFTNSQVEIDSSGGWDAEAKRYRVPADGYYLCGLWPGTISAPGTGTPWQVTGEGEKYMSLSLFDSDTNDVVMAVSGGSPEVANQYSGVDRIFGAIPVFLTNGAALGLRLTAVPGPARSQLPTYWFVSAIGGSGSGGADWVVDAVMTNSGLYRTPSTLAATSVVISSGWVDLGGAGLFNAGTGVFTPAVGSSYFVEYGVECESYYANYVAVSAFVSKNGIGPLGTGWPSPTNVFSAASGVTESGWGAPFFYGMSGSFLVDSAASNDYYRVGMSYLNYNALSGYDATGGVRRAYFRAREVSLQ